MDTESTIKTETKTETHIDAALLRPALPADLRAYLETRRDRLQGGHGLGLAAEIAALNRWLALPAAATEASS